MGWGEKYHERDDATGIREAAGSFDCEERGCRYISEIMRFSRKKIRRKSRYYILFF